MTAVPESDPARGVAPAWSQRAGWLAALAAAIAIPALWPSPPVVLLAPLRMLVEAWRERRPLAWSWLGAERTPSTRTGIAVTWGRWRAQPPARDG